MRARPNRRGVGRTVLGLDVTMADGTIHPLNAEGRSSKPRPVAAVADGIAGKWVPNIDDFTGFLTRLRTVPSSPGKHMVERLTLTDDRRQLRCELEVEDPVYLAEPFVVRALWDHRPDVEPSEVACDVETARRLLQA